jgi:hypothetical protein
MASIRSSRTSYTATVGEEPAPGDPLLDFAPVPLVAPRRNTLGPDRQRAFIAALAACGVVNQAARAIGASVEAVYKLRQRAGAEEFSAAWDRALDRAVQRLEDSAFARALNGEERMVVSSGKVMGSETRYNDKLVMFFLRNRRADRYGGEVRPGHPLYERIRADVLAEIQAQRRDSREEVLASLNAKIDQMRAREEEVRLMLAEDREWAEDGEWEDDG